MRLFSRGLGGELKKWERYYHGAMRFVWPILVIPTVLWWKDSILWVAIMGIYANFAAEVGAYQGAESVHQVEIHSEDLDER